MIKYFVVILYMEDFMKTVFFLLLLFLPYMLSASNSESDIKVAVLGKVTNFVKYKKPTTNENFLIVVYKDEDFAKLMQKKYANKQIKHKNVFVKSIATIQEMQRPNLLYIGKISQEEQQELIQYATKNSLFSVSSQSGFAKRGGVMQLYFLSQKIRFKINLNAVKKSNLKMSASLLSIATLVKGESK